MSIQNKTSAIVTSFHNYCGGMDSMYFDVIFDYYISNFNKYWRDEVDHLYLLDSNWNIEIDDPKITVIKTDPNDRYYDVYKKVLPGIKEGLIGFLDNDMVIMRKNIIKPIFDVLKMGKAGVCSIYDTCGTYKTDKLNGSNKFCPYFFFTSKDLLMNYLDCEWGPNLPEHETLGKLTELMLNDGVVPHEIEEDKTVKGKGLGYYHIRAGSSTAYLLTTRNFGNKKTYDDYIKNQPDSETLRHADWYEKMGGDSSQIKEDIRKKIQGN